MPSPPLARIQRALDALLVAVAGAFVLAYVATALLRISYPFELEWMEGGMVDHVRRILEGKAIYATPSLEFVSFLYPPLYYVAAAALAKILGVGFLPLRLLSFVSSLGVLGLVFAIVRREAGRTLPAAAAAGLFAAFYPVAGSWYDLARLDSFYMLLLLGGVFVLRAAASPVLAAAAGLLCAAAFFTKQSALVIVVPLATYALLDELRRGLAFTIAAAATGIAGVYALNATTAGWFSYYCFRLPARHPRLHGGAFAFWTGDVFPTLLPVAAGALAFAGWSLFRGLAGRRLFLPLLAAGAIGSSWSIRSVAGADVNNLLPSFAAFAILAGAGWDAVREDAATAGETRRSAALLVVSLLFLAQFGMLAYDPRRLVPSPADRAAGRAAVTRLASISGDVFVPHHGYLSRLAGKSGFAHTLAMDNVFLDDPGAQREALAAGMLQALRSRRFGAVVLESDGRYKDAILEGYEMRERLFEDPGVFWPVTGGRLRPEVICFPR